MGPAYEPAKILGAGSMNPVEILAQGGMYAMPAGYLLNLDGQRRVAQSREDPNLSGADAIIFWGEKRGAAFLTFRPRPYAKPSTESLFTDRVIGSDLETGCYASQLQATRTCNWARSCPRHPRRSVLRTAPSSWRSCRCRPVEQRLAAVWSSFWLKSAGQQKWLDRHRPL